MTDHPEATEALVTRMGVMLVRGCPVCGAAAFAPCRDGFGDEVYLVHAGRLFGPRPPRRAAQDEDAP